MSKLIAQVLMSIRIFQIQDMQAFEHDNTICSSFRTDQKFRILKSYQDTEQLKSFHEEEQKTK
jgi:hypothetical protein